MVAEHRAGALDLVDETDQARHGRHFLEQRLMPETDSKKWLYSGTQNGHAFHRFGWFYLENWRVALVRVIICMGNAATKENVKLNALA